MAFFFRNLDLFDVLGDFGKIFYESAVSYACSGTDRAAAYGKMGEKGVQKDSG